MYYESDCLSHHGVPGMKWGVRRYQNKDGSLTAAGKAHKSSGEKSQNETQEKKGLTDQQKKYIKIGAAVVGTAVIAYGAYKYSDFIKSKAAEAAIQEGKGIANLSRLQKVHAEEQADALMTKMMNPNNCTYANDVQLKRLLKDSKDYARIASTAEADYTNYANVLRNGTTKEALRYLKSFKGW